MCKNISKRIFIILICGWLAFSSSYIVYEKSYSYAMEWAGVTIGLDTAFKFLLGLLGVSCGVGVAEQIDWTQTRQDCMTFQQNQGQSAVAVSEWWSDVCDGVIDKTSACFTSFKEYVSSLISSNQDISVNVGANSDEVLNYINSYLGTNISNAGLSVVPVYAFTVNFNDDGSLWYCRLFTIAGGTYTFTGTYLKNSSEPVRWLAKNGNNAWKYDSVSSWNGINENVSAYFSSNIQTTSDVRTIPFGVSSDVPVESDFQGITQNIGDLTIINKGDTVIEGDTVINIPWDNVGDTAIDIDGVIDGLIDKVNEGVLDLDSFCEKVQNITNTYVYETTNNYIFPNGEENNEKIDDKINENISNEGFTLFGLEKFFPFCIPWDIYAFISILEADPVAPQIPVPIPNISTKQIDTYIIDLSPLEPVAVVMRYGFDFIFIIGLALMSRSLIGAGGSE